MSFISLGLNDGVAEQRIIKIGQRNGLQAQVIEGLQRDDRVILHPDNSIESGTSVRIRR